ncbi:hypothetical protein [Limnohabitans sp. Jir72]|uniref:hypothetical protein n=1 Tax=Limnohabitans sp. Jir72 TaxID=1977909 RepID=UPI000D3C7E2E|nr:hypothetical protein [Limnohabitans sp. Jir72]PUE31364.1 hypothetical protein B9Z52_10700 [Limnohabitans sp. Jir72]
MSKKIINAALLSLAAQAGVAATAWDPVSAGFYNPQTSSQVVFKFFENWKSIMTAPDCSAAAIDNKTASKHGMKGLRLGDICLMPADIRMQAMRTILTAMTADQKRLQDAQKQAISDGKLKEWESELNQKHVKMLKQGGGVGWITEEIAVAPDDKIAFEISTFVPASKRAYLSWIRRTYCAAAEESLNTDGPFYAALLSEYGQPTETISEGQFRAQQYELKMAEATKLADKQETLAKTAEEIAAVKLLRDEIKLLDQIKESEKNKPSGANNPPMAHQWKFDSYIVSINRSGECEGKRPRFVFRLSVHGAKNSLFSDLSKSSLAAVKKIKQAESPKK